MLPVSRMVSTKKVGGKRKVGGKKKVGGKGKNNVEEDHEDLFDEAAQMAEKNKARYNLDGSLER